MSTESMTPEGEKVDLATRERVARAIADNLPSPYALDDVWRQTKTGAVFDLSHALEDSREQWLAVADAAIAAVALAPKP